MRLLFIALEAAVVNAVTALAQLTVTTDPLAWAELKTEVSLRALELHIGVLQITEAALDLDGTPHEGTAAVLDQAADEVRAVAYQLNDVLAVL